MGGFAGGHNSQQRKSVQPSLQRCWAASPGSGFLSPDLPVDAKWLQSWGGLREMAVVGGSVASWASAFIFTMLGNVAKGLAFGKI